MASSYLIRPHNSPIWVIKFSHVESRVAVKLLTLIVFCAPQYSPVTCPNHWSSPKAQASIQPCHNALKGLHGEKVWVNMPLLTASFSTIAIHNFPSRALSASARVGFVSQLICSSDRNTQISPTLSRNRQILGEFHSGAPRPIFCTHWPGNQFRVSVGQQH